MMYREDFDDQYTDVDFLNKTDHRHAIIKPRKNDCRNVCSRSSKRFMSLFSQGEFLYESVH